MQLSEGSLKTINESMVTNLQPVLQLLTIKKHNNNRMLAHVSDGQHIATAILIGNCYKLIDEGQAKAFSVIKLVRYHLQPIEKESSRNVMIFFDAEVVAEANGKIGNPVFLAQEKQEDGVPGGGNQSTSSTTMPTMVSPQQPGGTGAVVKLGNQLPPGHAHVIPIAHLNPYNSNWTIKVRVTSKSDVRSGNKNGRDWRMFKAELLDNAGSEITATFFGDAVSLFYDVVKVGGVYLMSAGRVKLVDRRFTNIPGRDYEITFDDKSVIVPSDDDNDIATMQFDFLKLDDVVNFEAGKVVDFCGIIVNVGETRTITTRRDGKQLTKRDVRVGEDSGKSIDITLWGDEAINFSGVPGDPLAIKGGRVGDFMGGKTLSAMHSSVLQLGSELSKNETAQQLLKWWNSGGGSSTSFECISDRSSGPAGGSSSGPMDVSSRKTVEEILQPSSGDYLSISGGSNDISHVKGWIQYINRDIDRIMYPACKTPRVNDPTKTCMKKVTQDEEDSSKWTCSICGPTAMEYRYIISANIADDTDCANFVSFFNDQGNELLGFTADELHAFYENIQRDSNNPEWTAIFNAVLNKEYIFTLRTRMEMSNRGEEQQRVTVLRMRPVVGDTLLQECKNLADAIRKMTVA